MRKRRDLPSSGSTSGSINNKRKRTKKNDVDMISHLPVPILHHIFSFLDMKQAIQTTCLLSKSWRYFWVSLPTLKFNYRQGRRNIIRNEFMDFVDRVLLSRGNSNIHEFSLVTNYNINVTDRLNTWILDSIIHNVQQLTLNTFFAEKFHLHHCLFTCKSLTKLDVSADDNGVSLGLPYSITLPSLKTLSLKSVKFKDEYSTNRLFAGCPILESLNIYYCEFPHINVNITSPNLQELSLLHTRRNALDLGPVETNFQLCAPKLRSFYWSNGMSKHCAPENLSSLVKADISTRVYEDSMLSKEEKTIYVPFMVNILRGLHNVEDLKLSASFLEVVTGAPYLLDSQPMQFCNLRCLKLEGEWSSVDCIHAISYLLKISPNIETLFVDVHYGAPDFLEVQPTQCCNLRCLKLTAFLSRDCIYAMAYFLKISPKMENLSLRLYVSYPNDKMDSYLNPDEVTSNSAKIGYFWKAGLLLEGLLNHLKCFELRGVTGRINELEFIEILLKNAMLLEELLIFFIPYQYYVKEKELVQRRLAKFSEKGLDGKLLVAIMTGHLSWTKALIKLLATEIVDLLHWSDLAVTRKNKQSIESQNLRAVIDLNCFCKAMKVHIAVGFSSRQTDLINKAKIICECLVASDGMNLKFEEALCSFLLGQGGEAAAAERLRELEMSSGAASRKLEPLNQFEC